jgi:hypothetical protein
MADPHDWVKAKSVQKLKELQPELFAKICGIRSGRL